MDTHSPFRRNISLLTIAQALMMSGSSLTVTISALVGYALATDKSLATLPVAIQFIATMLSTIPAAMLMQRFGRKRCFVAATLLGLSGGALATWSIMQQAFWLFVAATVLLGMFNAVGNYYRFVAADIAPPERKSRAVSYVLAGGVVAAILGPNLAKYTRDLTAGAEFAGSYASLLVLYLLSFFALAALKLPHRNQFELGDQPPARPLRALISQPRFVVAVICATLGYSVMTLVMTATPLAMQHEAHPFDDTAFVIQWHVLAMFAPSFFTGDLIQRFGLIKILLTGALLGCACILINLLGTSLPHFWLALLLLGLSWNFLFIGGTTLLTQTYHPQERTKAQATNDFIVFTSVAVAALSAGALQHNFGWQAVNLGVIPLLAIILVSLIWLRQTEPQTRQGQEKDGKDNEGKNKEQTAPAA